MINYNSKDLVWILTKTDTDNRLWMPYKCTKFQLDQSTSQRVTAIFSSAQKDEEKWKRLESLPTHILETLSTIFFEFGVQSPLVGGHFHSNFGVLQIKDHGVMNV